MNDTSTRPHPAKQHPLRTSLIAFGVVGAAFVIVRLVFAALGIDMRERALFQYGVAGVLAITAAIFVAVVSRRAGEPSRPLLVLVIVWGFFVGLFQVLDWLGR